MVKSRVSAVDIRFLVSELRHACLGLRLANLYDISPKVYLLKFARPDHKEFVIIESGVRFHITTFTRSKPQVPSAFSLKLRKHIRTWRLENAQQLGMDRVVDLTFGRDETAHHLILEFYAKGNIILTDHEYNIITLLRTHKLDDGVRFAVRERYPVDTAVVRQPVVEPLLRAIFEDVAPGTTLKQHLNSKLDYGPDLIQHSLLTAGLRPNMKIGHTFCDENPDAWDALLQALQQVDELLENLGNPPHRGFIFKKVEATTDPTQMPYDDCAPALLLQFQGEGMETLPYDSYNAALDEFFSRSENTKLESASTEKDKVALSKVERVRKDHDEKVAQLQLQQDQCIAKAELIEANADDVNAALQVVRGALAQGTDWMELKRIIKEQKQQGNPIANLFHDLHLKENKVVLLLCPCTDDAAEEDLTAPAELVAVDIASSAHVNARNYYTNKKKTSEKEAKTRAATEKALKSAQRRGERDQKAAPPPKQIKVMRKIHWFEKFNWFITSQNFLVISGRDAQQNEILVKRYLKTGDIYVHADVHGASSCILKNPKNQPVPPTSLSQAGCMTVCRSHAWDSKAVSSAWWVYHNQVSKTAPTGEYLPTGSFMIRGKKNFLPPNPLLMGYTILFRVSDDDIPRHLEERRPTVESINHQAPSGTDEASLASIELSGNVSEELCRQGSLQEVSDLEEETATSPVPEDEPVFDLVDPEVDVDDDDATSPTGNRAWGETANTDFARYDLMQMGFDESLDPPVQEPNPEEEPGDALDKGGRKVRMSAKERRMAKKQQARGGAEAPEDEAEPPPPTAVSDGKKPQTVQVPRGKKGKLKKIARKYADQDDDERLVKMALLGHKIVEEEEEPPTRGGASADDTRNKHTPKPRTGAAADAPTRPQPPQVDVAEDAARREVAAGEGDTYLAAEDKLQLDINDLDSLTGMPSAQDTLMYALPMCAPYSALTDYKYKLKLTPGTAKRGKAVQQAHKHFLTVDAEEHERHLVRQMDNTELIATMLGSVRLTIPGAADPKAGEKKKKRGIA